MCNILNFFQRVKRVAKEKAHQKKKLLELLKLLELRASMADIYQRCVLNVTHRISCFPKYQHRLELDLFVVFVASFVVSKAKFFKKIQFRRVFFRIF